MILRMFELFCGMTSRYFGYFPTMSLQTIVVLPIVNTTVLESNAISTFSTSLVITDLRTAAGFLWSMKEHFSGALASGVV